jgi:hypothetical protein
MEVRYMGFEQRKNAREYQFNVTEKGQPSRHFVVTADLGMFLLHRVAIQEGPTLSASKLTSDLAKNFEGAHELTGDDLREYANASTLAKAQRAEMRKPPRRRTPPTAPAEKSYPGRTFGY